ncbi:MAG: hypothetical protein FJW86_05885 [Actinobacteria bacterium]|nr:hypothetical protein [Actinomycetota bacterium]
MPGGRIIATSWASNLLFAATAVPHALGVDSFKAPAVATALLLFALSMVVWPWVFAAAFTRSAQGDDIVVANLFLTVGDAPREVRMQLFWALAVNVVIAIGTTASEPFGALVPMLSLGLVGLWAARYGRFPPRPGSTS